jgi:asparagine synthase (glutamine-hydrolysing)
MARVQAHRGPDGEGFFTHGTLGLAHRRLAIIDAEHSEQPMASPDGRYTLVYNGELYNFRELRAELEHLGYSFVTQGDTEVVLASWVQWGRAAFDRFNGMFALAIADTQSGEITLVRDHFGIKPLYLASSGGVTVFASELRPILASGVVARRPDEVTIYRYLRFRVHDDTERTFFEGISRLMPGELATIAPDGTVTREIYTSLYDELEQLATDPGPYDENARARFKEALTEAVRTRLISDVPVGTALSGGLDSSTVVALVNRFLGEHDPEAVAVGERQQSFSAVFPGQRNDEEAFVDELAGTCKDLKVHKVYPDVDEFRLDMLDFVRTQEEPVISTGPYAQYCVMREASKHVTVMIDGQGADEMMAGYLPYFLVYMRQLKREGGKRRLAGEALRSTDILWRLGRFTLADKVMRRSNTPATEFMNPEFVERHADERFDVIPDDLKKRLVDDIFRHSLQSLLRYEDRNTMRFSIEGRVPFLDVTLLRTLWALDESAILHDSWNKRALRDATVEILPEMINKRRSKIGFTTPEDNWFAHLKEYLYEIFTSREFASRPYLNAPAVERAFEEFMAGKGGAETMTFWRLLNLELWLREYIDADPTAPGRVSPSPTETLAPDSATV